MTSSKTLKIYCQSRLIFEHCTFADSLVQRSVGLLRHKELKVHQAMLIASCRQVHSFFMSFPIDLVALNKNDEVVGVGHLKQWRISPIYWKAKKILECPAGSIERHNIFLGQKLEFRPC